MWKKSGIVGLAALFTVALAAGYAGWTVYRSSHEAICDVCMRPIHEHSRTVAEIDGRSEEFCCPTCALTAGRQAGVTVRFTEFTNYVNHQPLEPEEAYLVRGSNVNPCMQQAHEMVWDQEGQSVPMEFDRCAPSILAFSTAQIAGEFIGEHGGQLLRVKELEEQ